MKILPSTATGVSLFLVLHVLVITGNAQRGSRPSSSPSSFPGRPGGDNNIRNRDFDLLEREARKLPAKSAQRNPLAAQLKEDFERIQIISRDVIATNSSSEPLNHKLIENSATEIKRRASRLKSRLLFPDAEMRRLLQKQSDGAEEFSVKALMSKLDRSILSFALNPIFKNPGVLDVPNSAMAKRDLDQIIKFSDLLRKEAGKQAKQD